MLRGATVPAHWETVEAVYVALCDLAKWEPDDFVKFRNADASIRSQVLGCWHEALDNPDWFYPREPDPWATFGDAPF
jgi:hypothetical protein